MRRRQHPLTGRMTARGKRKKEENPGAKSTHFFGADPEEKIPQPENRARQSDIRRSQRDR